jgi:hypothetical protein
MKGRIITAAIAGLFLFIIVSYMAFMGRGAVNPPPGETSIRPLPTSPKNATVQIEGSEISLAEGHAKTDIPNSAAKRVTELVGEPVYGDVNDDGLEDAVLLLTHSEGGTGTFFYSAVALSDGIGYLGTNAVLLGDRITDVQIRVRNGVIRVRYLERSTEQSYTDEPGESLEAYIVLTNTQLDRIELDGAEYIEGTFSYGDSGWSVRPCHAPVGEVSTDSRSFGAIQAVYTARSYDGSPVFMSVIARRGALEDTVSYVVERILTVPTEGGGCTTDDDSMMPVSGGALLPDTNPDGV